MLPRGVLALVASGAHSAAAGSGIAAEHPQHAWPRGEGSSLSGSRHAGPGFQISALSAQGCVFPPWAEEDKNQLWYLLFPQQLPQLAWHTDSLAM